MSGLREQILDWLIDIEDRPSAHEVLDLLWPVIEAAEKLDKEYRKIKVSQQERTRCVYEMQGALETLKREVGGE